MFRLDQEGDLRASQKDIIILSLHVRVVEDLDRAVAAAVEWVEGLQCPSYHLHLVQFHNLLLLLLAIVFLPGVFKVGADHADRQREDTQAPDHGNTGEDLAPSGRGVVVPIADGGGRHERPPECVRNRLKGAFVLLRLESPITPQAPVAEAQVLPCLGIVRPLLDEEDDCATDEHVEADVQNQHPNSPHRPAHRSRDDDHSLEAATKTKGAHHAQETDELENDCGGALAALTALISLRGHEPIDVRGQNGSQVDEVGRGQGEADESLDFARPRDNVIGAHFLDQLVLIDELHPHERRRDESQDILDAKEGHTTIVDRAKDRERLRLTARARTLLHAGHGGHYEAPCGDDDRAQNEDRREAAQPTCLWILQSDVDSLWEGKAYREILAIP
mmetsp:Transcript_119209/g.254354  ORF Transcript_119209/g.254354 Transcript_119209/m.254354 type:complete len:389 (+) Transcript_119209:990-2156(+)